MNINIIFLFCMLIIDLNDCNFKSMLQSKNRICVQGQQMKNSLLANSGAFTAVFINVHCPC